MTIAPDPHAALAAYVLHALTPEEDEAFARHLAVCTRCRREAASLRAAAAELAEVAPVAPPPGLRRRVLDRIAATPQDPLPAADGPRRPHPAARPGRALRWALAASLALAAAFGGIAYLQHRAAEEARARLAVAGQAPAARLAEVLAAPDARITATEFPDGATGCVIISRSESRAAFIASGLPKLSADQVYALWYDDIGGPRPAGTFPGRGNWHIELLDGPVERATAVGVTVEPVGGSAHPSTEPIGVIEIPA
ncbi:anti-sigma factor [Streptomyces sp. NBC_01408]|uniref:anti-sigma factor n=1 Tax=Streptomyces sp. NBC_01408 TaxID=2903855 RepID=UPI00224DD8AF|nr:anti-sigma factor [Streptomyces sp. NBC_01408]MCX4695895.1 anti-sigma factor [Streptomyces sp. NBC_01408]